MKALFVISLCLSLTGCAQKQKPESITKPQYSKTHMMDLSKVTNDQVKSAIEALQNGDKSWYTYFTENPEMTDDGHQVNFKSFFAKALGNEKFLNIDKVENNGKTVYGNFKAGQWGTFRVFFKFHENATGKFERLDIGQAN
ncbi:hypothetical protein HZP84_07370 [Elizabethkingia anophelis]|nr:hypothetical protein [Elizabethkingia anophelis]MCT3822807.1 hypothetical protein [Elizabethkingia anophelis]MCT3930125.1 hypothetical protein [Elizabethkingia anophelis]MCT4076284.1 hypothetical protein [Elizabethkingia anophelis]MCT4079952.1 hypothetical protein [Elizabethkingia anophelis]